MSAADSTPVPVEETRAEDAKPLDTPQIDEPSKAPESADLANEEPKTANDGHALDTPQIAETDQTTETPVTEKLVEDHKSAEPITSGTLGYKAPGLLK